MLMFLMFLTSVVTIWKFWKLSEKYIPKDLIYQSRQKNKKRVKNSVSKNVLARSMALWHTVKHGGNDMENDQKMKNKIKKAVKDK
jgi:G:T/U-mismatch repair DNA glycosylase